MAPEILCAWLVWLWLGIGDIGDEAVDGGDKGPVKSILRLAKPPEYHFLAGDDRRRMLAVWSSQPETNGSLAARDGYVVSFATSRTSGMPVVRSSRSLPVNGCLNCRRVTDWFSR